jgi:hypothetical protein
MIMDGIIEKLKGPESQYDSLDWEEHEFLRNHLEESLPGLFAIINSVDYDDWREFHRALRIFQILIDLSHYSEDFQIDDNSLQTFDKILRLYPSGPDGCRTGSKTFLEGIVVCILKIFRNLPSHGNIPPLIDFLNVNPIVTLPEDVNSSILQALHSVVRSSNYFETEDSLEELPLEVSKQLLDLVTTAYLNKPEYTKIALEIIVDLDISDAIEIVAPFLHSTDELCRVALYYLRDFWDEAYLDTVAEIARRGDASWTTLAAIRVLGDRGTGEYIEQLLVDLERYSSLSGRGYKRCRDAVEKALVNLRQHCEEDLVFLAIDEHISPGHRKAVKRVLKMIGEAKDQRRRVDYNWVHELYSWRTRKAREEEIDYIPRILTDDHIYKIYNRQPLTYLDLLSIDGIGPYKINQYGSEILNIVNNNQLEEYKTEIPERWNLSFDMESYLINSCMLQFNPNDVSGLSDSQIAEFLKSHGAHTKGQLKKLLQETFDSIEKEIVNSILDYLISKIRFSETEFTLLEGGVKRGKRFALLTR